MPLRCLLFHDWEIRRRMLFGDFYSREWYRFANAKLHEKYGANHPPAPPPLSNFSGDQWMSILTHRVCRRCGKVDDQFAPHRRS